MARKIFHASSQLGRSQTCRLEALRLFLGATACPGTASSVGGSNLSKLAYSPLFIFLTIRLAGVDTQEIRGESVDDPDELELRCRW